ncbi:uncharacterized protein LOC131255459 [Magnolia sinica]|uniref:uncharacterized protein LOC131255459 n=1 Tax=Magnolia sinica TaxID=86752 RepID=UPI00265A2F66|nr:uncharacterized protein LOC131255459 [Magnolia sinica]
MQMRERERERAMMLRRSLATLLESKNGRYSRTLLSSSSSSSSCFSFSQSASNAATAAGVDVSAGAGQADIVFTPSKIDAPPSLLQPGVVVYDGVCHLCYKGVKWVIRADKYRKIKFCCLQSRAAEPYLRASGLDREDVLRRFLFVEGPGLYHQASTAALKVASYLPLPYSALSILLVIPAPIRDAIYDYIAKRRYDWFGKEDDCIVMEEKEMLERFIDWEEMLDRHKSKSV